MCPDFRAGAGLSRRAIWIALAVLVACRDNTGVGPTDRAGLVILSGAGARDTALAQLAAPLIVEIRDAAGRPLPGVAVRFEPEQVAGAPPWERWTSLQPVGTTPPIWTGDYTVTDTTDSDGRASVQVGLGRRAGTGTVFISAPALGYQDTASYAILPGSPVGVAVLPADTAVYVGSTYALRGGVVDQHGNSHPDPITYSTPSITIDVSDAVVSGRALGRGIIVVQAGGQSDTGYVSVVPVGTIAAHLMRAYVGDSIGVAVVNLDGSGFRRVTVEAAPGQYGGEEPPGREMTPRWSPSAARLVYQEGDLDHDRLMSTDLAGERQTLAAAAGFASAFHPDVSRDGSWVYFAARTGDDPRSAIWRVRQDGTGMERVAPAEGFTYEHDSWPAPSADGTRLAYAAAYAGYGEPRVRVRNVTTGARTALDLHGVSPRWSPDGTLIAYVQTHGYSGYSGLLRVVRPDGSGDRPVVTDMAYAAGIDWSPDGRYLIAKAANYGVLELVEVATGARIPLPYSWRLMEPAWRPGSSP